MAYIKIELDHKPVDGEQVTFKAPCDCTEASSFRVYYPNTSGTSTTYSTFTLKDSHCNTVTTLGNLFSENALVTVLINMTNKYAHILNADTNKYLEDKIEEIGGTNGTSNLDYNDDMMGGISGSVINSTLNWAKAGKMFAMDVYANFKVLSKTDIVVLEISSANVLPSMSFLSPPKAVMTNVVPTSSANTQKLFEVSLDLEIGYGSGQSLYFRALNDFEFAANTAYLIAGTIVGVTS